MADSDSQQKYPPAADDLLPPVEPPSAGFIIQLFVVPALIVLVIVGVWLLFTTLVRRSSPETILQGLESGPSIARWQRASELADMLRSERFADFKRDSASAQHVARVLNREMGAGGMEDGEVTLRLFLARALGEFEVQDGIETLIKAATTERAPAERAVRYDAIEAIAVRAYNLQQLKPPQQISHPELEPTLIGLAGDEDPQLRHRVAYALGKTGTPAAIERLQPMLDDPDPDTRYNAAVALAHHGDAHSVETLAEMLDLDETAGVREEKDERTRAFKRAVIVASALGAVEALAKKNSGADLAPVIVSLERLSNADAATLARAQLPPRVASDAKQTLKLLQAR
jgi:HEAT repeat protein